MESIKKERWTPSIALSSVVVVLFTTTMQILLIVIAPNPQSKRCSVLLFAFQSVLVCWEL